MPEAASSAPQGSSRAVEVEHDSGRTFAPMMSARIETGTLIQKICAPSQIEQVAVNEQPAQQWAGDRRETLDRPVGAERLGTLARSERCPDDPNTCGTMIPAVSPCEARMPMSIPGSAASAQSAEASMNPASPIMNRRLRPYWSPSRPPVTRPAPRART